jgi:hypothetical protein
MVKEESVLKGHNKLKKLDGGIQENLQVLRECVNELYDNSGNPRPSKLVRLNELFDNE